MFRRGIQAIPIMFGISVIVFLIIYLSPGDPTARFRVPRVPPEQIQALIRAYGLDKPLLEQYVAWITTFVQVWRPEAWGYSFLNGQPVLDVILGRVPATVRLMGASLIITIIFAIPIGVLAAVKQYSWTDKIITTLATIGYAIPSFLIGLLILYFGGVVLKQWTGGALGFPLFGMESLGKRGDWLDIAWHLVLPVTSLAIQQIAAWARFMRTSMLEVLHQDYVRTARAKGLPRARVLGKHALRNALIPIVTLLGLSVPALLAGAVITETIFSYPGLGSLVVNSVAGRDYPVVLALTMLGGLTVVLGNLLADVLYGVVDPRIKY
ncbi:MAG: ABC transporter permease [Chloroflexi bacterium]|nr:ABC transporter permease [Chloroflexota bacterium]